MNTYITITDENFDRKEAEEFFQGKVGKGRALTGITIIKTGRTLEEVSSFKGIVQAEEDQADFIASAETELVPRPEGGGGLVLKQTNANWALEHLSRPYDDAFYYERAGDGVDIYIVDTGIKDNHPDFPRHVEHLYSFDSNQYGSSHGTKVASNAAGSRCGVAKRANLFSCRTGDGAHYRSEIYKAFDTIAWHHWAKSSKNPSVVNMSIYAKTTSDGQHREANEVYRYALHQLYTSGIIVVACSGNTNEEYENWNEQGGLVYVPAAFEDCISVGAHGSNNTRSSFSCYGSNIEVWAPGSSVLVADFYPSSGANLYGTASGTSMSSPLVAGAVALLLEGSVQPTNHSQVETVRQALLTHLTSPDLLYASSHNSTNRVLKTYNPTFWSNFTPLIT